MIQNRKGLVRHFSQELFPLESGDKQYEIRRSKFRFRPTLDRGL